MNPRENILERLRTIKPVLQQEFPLRRMALFGSWAQDEQHVDLVSSRAVKPKLLKQIETELIDV